MAGLFLDSFDHYNTALLTTKWASTTGGASGSVAILAAAGRNGTDAVRITYLGGGNASGPELQGVSLGVTGPTAVVGLAGSISSLTSAARIGLLSVYDGASVQVSVKINADGTLSVLRGDVATGTVLGTTASGITVAVYSYIEVKTLIDPTVGTYEVRINGASVLSGTGANTRATAASQWTRIGLGKSGGNTPGATCNLDLDDLYVCDGSGAQNNTFLNDGRVFMQLPSVGNGANADWTPSTGTDHGALVDENPPNTSDFNSSNTVGQRDTYLYPALGVTGTVKMVQTCLYVGKSDAGARTVAPVQRISGVNYDGTAVAPATTFAYKRQVYDQSPATASTWTVSEIDATETGIKLVS